MSSAGQTEVKAVSRRRAYISLPKKHMASLAQKYELDHGLILTNVNAYLNEGYIKAYFKEWGTVTACRKQKTKKSMVYVGFSTEEEADRADWAGPHYIGGTEVNVRRVVSPKMEEDSVKEVDATPAPLRPRRSMGLGYILEDAQWLGDEEEE